MRPRVGHLLDRHVVGRDEVEVRRDQLEVERLVEQAGQRGERRPDHHGAAPVPPPGLPESEGPFLLPPREQRQFFSRNLRT
jgi:hypothetical protein